MAWFRQRTERPVIVSPNIWNWPDIYEVENDAQDADGAIWAVLSEVAPWSGRDVVDVGCGTGFHLPHFARTAESVLGVEPHAPLAERARLRVSLLRNAAVAEGTAAQLPLGAESVDLVHARTAYFFGPGCEPGITEALRVLRPGGVLAIVDLDATAHPYGAWMRADLPRYRPLVVEDFFRRRGFGMRKVDTRWIFRNRRDLESVLRIEFSRRVADRACRETAGLTLDVRYRVHYLSKTLARGR